MLKTWKGYSICEESFIIPTYFTKYICIYIYTKNICNMTGIGIRVTDKRLELFNKSLNETIALIYAVALKGRGVNIISL